MSLPNKITNIGRLDDDAWRAISNMAEYHNNNEGALNALIGSSSTSANGLGWFFARITGNKPIELTDATDNGAVTRRWRYSWERAEIDPSDTTGASFRTPVYQSDNAQVLSSTVTTDGVANKFANYAINMCEADNRRTRVGPGYGFVHVMPVGECEASKYNKQADDSSGTTDTIFLNVVVLMYGLKDSSGKKRFYFHTHNAHNNACMKRDYPNYVLDTSGVFTF